MDVIITIIVDLAVFLLLFVVAIENVAVLFMFVVVIAMCAVFRCGRIK